MKRFLVLVMALFLMTTVAYAEEQPFIGPGDYNENVVSLNQKLIDLGYLSLRAESPFSRRTSVAWKALQYDAGLEETGVVRD